MQAAAYVQTGPRGLVELWAVTDWPAGVTMTGYQAGPGWDLVTGLGLPTPRSSSPARPLKHRT
jgi:hypothetical protein